MQRFKPFSQSLINQGMNQTNRIAANATNPPNITSQPYTTFNNNNINPGGGNVMGGPGFGPGSEMLGVGEFAPGAGAGGNIGLGDVWIEGVQGHMGFGGSMGGDAFDESQAEQETEFNQLMEQGIFTLPGDGGYTIADMTNLYGDVWEQSGLGNSTFNTPEEALEALQLLQNLQTLNEQGFYDEAPPSGPYDLDLDFGAGFGAGFGSGGFDFGSSGLYGGGADWSSFDFANMNQQEAPIYTGGGGQGAQLAKKLYYPGTTGGFASVGSGIGGDDNMLQKLLKGLG